MLGTLLNSLIPGLTSAIDLAYVPLLTGVNIVIGTVEGLLGSVINGLFAGI